MGFSAAMLCLLTPHLCHHHSPAEKLQDTRSSTGRMGPGGNKGNQGQWPHRCRESTTLLPGAHTLLVKGWAALTFLEELSLGPSGLEAGMISSWDPLDLQGAEVYLYHQRFLLESQSISPRKKERQSQILPRSPRFLSIPTEKNFRRRQSEAKKLLLRIYERGKRKKRESHMLKERSGAFHLGLQESRVGQHQGAQIGTAQHWYYSVLLDKDVQTWAKVLRIPTDCQILLWFSFLLKSVAQWVPLPAHLIQYNKLSVYFLFTKGIFFCRLPL